jgi:hypothetical protein
MSCQQGFCTLLLEFTRLQGGDLPASNCILSQLLQAIFAGEGQTAILCTAQKRAD